MKLVATDILWSRRSRTVETVRQPNSGAFVLAAAGQLDSKQISRAIRVCSLSLNLRQSEQVVGPWGTTTDRRTAFVMAADAAW